MHPVESSFWMAPTRQQIGKKTMLSKFADMTSSSNFFDIAAFLLSSLDTIPRYMPISWLIREL